MDSYTSRVDKNFQHVLSFVRDAGAGLVDGCLVKGRTLQYFLRVMFFNVSVNHFI